MRQFTNVVLARAGRCCRSDLRRGGCPGAIGYTAGGDSAAFPLYRDVGGAILPAVPHHIMLNVFFTVDVEVWCDGWDRLDENFPRAFRSYVHGPTPRGEYGLPFQARLLADHGLPGVFFVEPLFSLRFGREPLAEIVSLVDQGVHEVQLHLHPEWVDEARTPPVAVAGRKRPLLREFSLADQQRLIGVGRDLLAAAGSGPVNAFRAGSFGFNADTLQALAALDIPFDSSYDACQFGRDSGVRPGEILVDATACGSVIEYPMTVFRDGSGGLRHVQLTACSAAEIEGLLWQALGAGMEGFVILSHNFELLTPSRREVDPVVLGRFRRLCAFLDRHRDVFRVRGFRDLPRSCIDRPREPLTSPVWRTAMRYAVQAYRRRFA